MANLTVPPAVINVEKQPSVDVPTTNVEADISSGWDKAEMSFSNREDLMKSLGNESGFDQAVMQMFRDSRANYLDQLTKELNEDVTAAGISIDQNDEQLIGSEIQTNREALLKTVIETSRSSIRDQS
jgi:hypothetical protein